MNVDWTLEGHGWMWMRFHGWSEGPLRFCAWNPRYFHLGRLCSARRFAAVLSSALLCAWCQSAGAFKDRLDRICAFASQGWESTSLGWVQGRRCGRRTCWSSIKAHGGRRHGRTPTARSSAKPRVTTPWPSCVTLNPRSRVARPPSPILPRTTPIAVPPRGVVIWVSFSFLFTFSILSFSLCFYLVGLLSEQGTRNPIAANRVSTYIKGFRLHRSHWLLKKLTVVSKQG